MESTFPSDCNAIGTNQEPTTVVIGETPTALASYEPQEYMASMAQSQFNRGLFNSQDFLTCMRTPNYEGG